jgi:RimJ/RimL family protein N-acetyltransferase
MSLRYRLVTKNDAALLTKHRNENRHCFFDSGAVTEEQTLTWIIGNLQNSKDFMFIVEEEQYEASSTNYIPVGQFSVYNVMQGDRAKCGRVIRYRDNYILNSSYFVGSCFEIIKHISSLYNLHTLVAEVYAWNKPSLMFFAKLGFHVCTIENENTSKAVFELVKKV